MLKILNINPENKELWRFLLLEKSELMFLFPFWRYLEFIWLKNHFRLKNLVYSDISWRRKFRKIIAQNMRVSALEIVKRVLVWEFHNSHKKNLTITLKDFLEAISEIDQLDKLYSKYPVLQNLLEKVINNHNEYVQKLFTRLCADFDEIQKTFHLKNFRFEYFKLIGDSHCIGSSVALVSFRDLNFKKRKKFIYKPRNIGLEKKFNELLKFINNEIVIKTPLKVLIVISKINYGWMEYANQLEIEPSKAKIYYYKLGILLGVCFTLNAQDMHFENLIASGEDPVLVDLECLFSPPITSEQLLDFYFPSVFETLLIPSIKKTTNLSRDFSGVMNIQDQEAIIDHFEVKGDFDSNVYIERRKGVIKPVGNILINKITGKAISSSHYVSMITEGFCKYLYWVIENKEMLINQLTLLFVDVKSRILFRPTFIYNKILIESYHPKLLSSFENYNLHLEQLVKKDNALYEILYSHEFFDLLNGDIPYFSTVTTTAKVKNSQNEEILWNTLCPGVDRVIGKINLIEKSYITNIVKQIFISLEDRYA